MPTTPKQIEAKIKKANALYKRSTPAQRRVLIAKDGLKQLACGKTKARSGRWADVRLYRGRYLGRNERHEPLQPYLLKPKVTCMCCGVGALFLSYVRLNNEAVVGDGEGFATILQTIGWPQRNLALIETAFERRFGYASSEQQDARAALEFGRGYDSHTDRLVAILKNIVKNNGTFKP